MAQPATNAKIEELRFRLKTDPKTRLFYQLAEELRRASQFGEAEYVLRNGLIVYPTYLAAWVSLGRVLREQKNEAGAVEALNRALQLDPGNVVAARLLADAYFALGEKVEAIKKYKLVHALLPADEEVRTIIEALEQELGPPPAVTPTPETAAPEVEEAVFNPGDAAGAPDDVLEPESVGAGTLAAIAADAEPISAPEAEDLFGGDERVPAEVVAAAPAEAAAGPADIATDDSPFDRTTPPFGDAAKAFGEEIRLETATGDIEPMGRAHDDSPFEDPVENFTAAAVELEAPLGMQIVSAPLAADVPAYVDEDLPTVDSTPVFDTPAPAGQPEDVGSTITMADLYVRQGLVEEARHIYERILGRDPGNDSVRAKLAAITPRLNTKVVVLERWLAKVARREVGRV